MGFQQGQLSVFTWGSYGVQRTCVSAEGGGWWPREFLPVIHTWSELSWSDARNTSSPKGRGKWLTAVGASSSLPHRLLLNCHYLLTYSPGCVRALPEVARGMISINSLPWGENELLLIYFSPRSLKPTKVTGTFIFCSFPISLTLRLFLSNILNPQTLLDIIHLPLIIHTSGSYRQCGGIVKVATLTRDGFQFISVLVQF